MAMHAVALRTRSVAPGAMLTLMVLADGPEGCATIDISSGALVRAAYPGRPDSPLGVYDLVRAPIAEDPDGPDPTQPEAVSLAAAPTSAGRLRGRQARRLIEPLLLPDGQEPLGFAGSAIPYWTVPGNRPSLALLRPQRPPVVQYRPSGRLVCRFGWRNVELELPVAEPRVAEAMAAGWPRLGGKALDQVLGYGAAYLLVALSAPQSGRCYKVVAGFLPRP